MTPWAPSTTQETSACPKSSAADGARSELWPASRSRCASSSHARLPDRSPVSTSGSSSGSALGTGTWSSHKAPLHVEQLLETVDLLVTEHCVRTRPRPPGPEASRSRAVARKSLGLLGMSRRHQREPYDPSVLVDAVPHASGASGDPTRRCLAVEQPARLDAGVDRHSAYTELLQVVAIEVQPEALQVLHELVAAQTRARAPQ